MMMLMMQLEIRSIDNICSGRGYPLRLFLRQLSAACLSRCRYRHGYRFRRGPVAVLVGVVASDLPCPCPGVRVAQGVP